MVGGGFDFSQRGRGFLDVMQVGPTNEDFRRDACVSLTCHIAHVSAFQKLRTELQLGCATPTIPEGSSTQELRTWVFGIVIIIYVLSKYI